MTIKSRMTLAVSAIFVAFSLCAGLLAVTAFGKVFRSGVTDEVTLISDTLADDLDSRLGLAKTALGAAAAALPATALASPPQAQRFLAERVTLHSLFPDEIVLLDRLGNILAFYPPTLDTNREDYRHHPAFLTTLVQEEPHIAQPAASDRENHLNAIHVATPVRDGDGKTAAVLLASLDLMRLNLLQRSLQPGQLRQGQLILLGPDQRAFYRFSKARQQVLTPPSDLGFSSDASRLYNLAQGGQEKPARQLVLEGIPSLASFRHLRQANWVLVFSTPEVEAFAPLLKAQRHFVGIFGLTALLLLGLTWLLARRLTAPLQQMTRHVQRYSELPPQQRALNLVRGDEIGTLAQAFDSMLATVQQQQEALRQAAEKAETERARSEAILAALGDGLSIQDRNFRVLYQNDVHKALIGDWCGAICHVAYAGQDAICPGCPVEATFQDGQVHRLEKTTGPPERPITVELSASPLRDVSGQIIAGLELVRDITERTEREKEIRTLNSTLNQRMLQLSAANRELESFGYSLSHDLKTPLAGVYTSAQILYDAYLDRFDDNGRFLLETLCRSCERMDEILDAMLQLSHLGQSHLQREQVDISALARLTLLTLQQAESERSIEWSVAPDIIVHGDPRLLHSALENLLGNAWKYSGKTERARIEFGCLETERGRVCFVRDNGSGFDSSKAAEIFQPFRRLHGRGEYAGLGIGLATVRKIIERHGGEIWAESAPGEGATFYFTCPDAATTQEAPGIANRSEED